MATRKAGGGRDFCVTGKNLLASVLLVIFGTYDTTFVL